MKFAIRDDDICYHTQANELETIYGQLSRICPISFSVIPYVGKHSLDDINAWDGWWRTRLTKQVCDVADNKDLITLLRRWVSQGRAEILLHGIHHQRFEFAEDRPFVDDVREAKAHLEGLFDCDVTVATPPNNTMGRAATRAISFNEMNVLIAYGHRLHERPVSLRSLGNFFSLLIFYFRFGKRLRYPYPMKFPGHIEQACYHYGPRSSWRQLRDGVDYTYERGGNFVVGTHFYHLVGNEAMRDGLYSLVDYASSMGGGDVQFATARHLF